MKAVLRLVIYLPQEEGSGSDEGGKAGPLQLQVVWRQRPEGVTGAEVRVRNCQYINQHCAWLPQLQEGKQPAGNFLPLSSRQLSVEERKDDKLAAEEGEMGLPLQ